MGIDYDVIVVGGGVVGVATARAAARSGRSVLLLEQHRFDHSGGSSHGGMRAFAFAHPDPALVDDAVEALALWRELEAEQGVELIERTGSGLRTADVERVTARLAAHGVEHEVLEPEQVAARFGIDLAPGGPVVVTREGGTLYARRAIEALVASARAAGAELRAGARVLAIEADAATGCDDATAARLAGEAIEPGGDGDGVTVRCADGTCARAATVVVAAGPWAAPLLAPLGIALDVKVVRRTVAFFPLRSGAVLPPCIYEDGDPPVYWVSSAAEGLKIGEARSSGPLVDPDVAAGPSAELLQRLTDYVARHFSQLAEPAPSRAESCLATYTPDRAFRLERHGRVVSAAACCGRGFKLAPLTGERLAHLARDPALA
ncbi:MAG TPA: FAD-dependent oxidoreductase [Conexibacter sp.]|jgi:sarcosine oxidase